MSEAEMKFRNIVVEEAETLIDELKSVATNYGEVRHLLKQSKKAAKWKGPDNPYLLVLSVAEEKLEREIDAITITRPQQNE